MNKDNGGQNRGNSQGKDLGRFKGYLEGIFGNSSLTTIQGTTKKNIRKTKKNLRTAKNTYARNLILVTLILVNFFGFLVITRYHEIFEGCQ